MSNILYDKSSTIVALYFSIIRNCISTEKFSAVIMRVVPPTVLNNSVNKPVFQYKVVALKAIPFPYKELVVSISDINDACETQTPDFVIRK